MVFTKTLNITRGDVGNKHVTLLLTFQVPDPEKLYHDQFSVAWRVIDFSGQGTEFLNVEYISQLFVANPEILAGNHIKPNQLTKIELGQKTILEKQGSDVVFTDPVKGTDKLIIAENNTGSLQDFAIGIVEGGIPTPLLVFRKIGTGSALRARFTPVLQAYVISGYQKTVLLRGEIESVKPIWSQDLVKLDPSTNWQFEQDPATGAYSITQA